MATLAPVPNYGQQIIRFAETAQIPADFDEGAEHVDFIAHAVVRIDYTKGDNGTPNVTPNFISEIIAHANGGPFDIEVMGVVQQDKDKPDLDDNTALNDYRLCTVATSGLLMVQCAPEALTDSAKYPVVGEPLLVDGQGIANSDKVLADPARPTINGKHLIVRELVLTHKQPRTDTPDPNDTLQMGYVLVSAL